MKPKMKKMKKDVKEPPPKPKPPKPSIPSDQTEAPETKPSTATIEPVLKEPPKDTNVVDSTEKDLKNKDEVVDKETGSKSALTITETLANYPKKKPDSTPNPILKEVKKNTDVATEPKEAKNGEPFVRAQKEKDLKVVPKPQTPAATSTLNQIKNLKRSATENLGRPPKESKKNVLPAALPSVDLATTVAAMMDPKKMALPQSAPGFPNVLSFLQAGGVPGPSGYPMFPHQSFFGFPIDYSSDAFLSQCSLMANYLARVSSPTSALIMSLL